MTVPTSFYFFLHPNPALRYLPSFPTRRSSDLILTARAKGLGEARVIGKHTLRNSAIPIVTLGIAELRSVCLPITRSEEHTSELQSHSELVCRLLLEKKKRKNTKREASTNKRRY